MKNELNRYWIFMFLITCILYAGMRFLLDVVRERDIEVFEFLFAAVFFSTVMILIQKTTTYPLDKRIKYLEDNDSSRPSIKSACSFEMDIPTDYNFNRLKTEIGNKWLVTFSDDKEQVLKFRTRFTFFGNSWGTAAWLKVNDDAGKIYVDCFPMALWQVNRYTREMKKEIEQCIQPNYND